MDEELNNETINEKTSLNKFESKNSESINNTAETIQFETKNTAKMVKKVQKRPNFGFLVSFLSVFALCFLTYILCFQVILRPISVAGYSMQPNINTYAKGSDGQLYTDIVYYSTDVSNISNGEIVIINSNYTNNNHSLIKRVIAGPNDTITFKTIAGSQRYNPETSGFIANLDVYVNGVKLDELSISASYQIKEVMELELNTATDIEAYSFYNTFNKKLTLYGEFSYNLGADEYFVMGDNRNNSTDSRFFGPVNKKDIEGKLVLLVPYGENLATVLFNKIFR